MWLRGVIAPHKGTSGLRAESLLLPEFPHIIDYELEDSLTEAIAVEKSGIQGMRLLIGGGFSKNEVERASQIHFGDYAIVLARRLRGSAYPAGVCMGRFRDILWMATADDSEWKEMMEIMAKRIRWALSSHKELAHAGATYAVFSVCNAVIGTFRHDHGMQGGSDQTIS
jgi:hypothetical protein